jgi:protein-tyrosine phosphatase
MWVMSITGRTPTWIDLDGAANARVVVPGVLVRSDNLQQLSARDLRTLVDEQRVRVVLDLRTGEELFLEGPGPMTREPLVRIEHRSLYPEAGHTDFDVEEVVIPWGKEDDGRYAGEIPTVRSYMGYLTRRPDSITESVRAIATTDGAALVHCAAGKDRTGVVVAMALDAAGWDREVIVEDYLFTTQRIEQIMEHLRSSETYRAELEGHSAQRHAPVPGAMDRVLELIDSEFGGTVEFLRHNGLDQAELEQLRGRLNGD